MAEYLPSTVINNKLTQGSYRLKNNVWSTVKPWRQWLYDCKGFCKQA